ncbi:MAG: hypothetical protein J1E95_03655 [Muribaculaceae bacterium]|nr:hypothetical protein [Muribaculaceae bacterium]
MKRTVETVYDQRRDPQTGALTWIPVEIVKTTLEETDRIQIVNEILGGKITVEEVRKQYKLSSPQVVWCWIGKYLSQIKSVSLQEETEEEMARKSKDEQIKELKAQLKKKEKELELEKLRSHAYDKMIDVAEEMFNIPIRKKAGTKQ